MLKKLSAGIAVFTLGALFWLMMAHSSAAAPLDVQQLATLNGTVWMNGQATSNTWSIDFTNIAYPNLSGVFTDAYGATGNSYMNLNSNRLILRYGSGCDPIYVGISNGASVTGVVYNACTGATTGQWQATWEGGGGTPTPTPDPNCPTDTFIDVSEYQQQPPYPDPVLNVYCNNDHIIAESNGIPNFEFVPITPNQLQEQDYTWMIPLNPQEAAQPSNIPLLGPVAIAVNGLPIFGPNEAPPTYGDPFLDGILDYCLGHTAQFGNYHFHARPECLFTDIEGNTSLILGYAFDGYPIMAPFICADPDCNEVTEVQSSWVLVNPGATNAWVQHQYIEGAGDLDQCNGMVGPDGDYRYYATDTFPYFLGCYHGVAELPGPPGPP